MIRSLITHDKEQQTHTRTIVGAGREAFSDVTPPGQVRTAGVGDQQVSTDVLLLAILAGVERDRDVAFALRSVVDIPQQPEHLPA